MGGTGRHTNETAWNDRKPFLWRTIGEEGHATIRQRTVAVAPANSQQVAAGSHDFFRETY